MNNNDYFDFSNFPQENTPKDETKENNTAEVNNAETSNSAVSDLETMPVVSSPEVSNPEINTPANDTLGIHTPKEVSPQTTTTTQNQSESAYVLPNMTPPPNLSSYYQPLINPDDEVMTVGKWFLTMLLLSIPCIGLIFAIVWLIGNGNRNRVNLLRAYLLFSIFMIVLSFAIVALMAPTLYPMIESLNEALANGQFSSIQY